MGGWFSTPQFTAASIPSQEGKVIAITGANVGLGFESARHLLRAGASKVIVLARDDAKGNSAVDALNGLGCSGRAVFEKLDLGDLDSVRACVQRLNASEAKLDVLMLNAGVMPVEYKKTKSGFEEMFGVNNIGHFVFTLLLVPLLRKSVASRVVVVASTAHRFVTAEPDWNDVALRGDGRTFSRFNVYGTTKLCNLLFARALQRHLEANDVRNITVLSSQPGFSSSSLQRDSFLDWANYLAMSPEQGSLTQVRAAVDPTLKALDYIGPDGFGGAYGNPVVEVPSALALDDEVAERFWKLAEKETGVALKV
jgi:NAD(P)-dependent dehydrogenase (short-subunit alcohol dehydrogenase family)